MNFDALGIPKVELATDDLDFLKALETKGDLALEQEKRKLLVEYFMLRGIKSPTKIAREVDVSRSTVRKYIKQIEFRWSIREQAKLSGVKESSLAFLDLINRELWKLYESPNTSNTAKLRAITRLLQVHDRIVTIFGLNGSRASHFQENECVEYSAYTSVEQKINEHKQAIEVAEKIAEYLTSTQHLE